MNELKQFWRGLRTSFWFVPSLIIAASVLLAVALIEAESIGSGQWQARWPRLFGASAAGARDVVHDCRLDDDRGGGHVFDDLGDAGAGLEPIHLTHTAELHA